MGKKISFATKPSKTSTLPKAADQWVSEGDPREEKKAPEEKPSLGPMKRLTIDVPADLHLRIKIGCAKRGHKMADEIRALLEKKFPQ